MPTRITYIGKRERYVDGLYATGEWLQGQTKPVHDETARKMLKHADQYQLDGVEAAAPTGKALAGIDADVVGLPDKKKDDSEEESQEARDSVAYMDKDALIEYAQVHFRQSIDKRMSVENVRQRVVGLIDQFGLS